MYNDIKNRETFCRIEPISKGLSGDEKFAVETNDRKSCCFK